jgi:hypothetical protein
MIDSTIEIANSWALARRQAGRTIDDVHLVAVELHLPRPATRDQAEEPKRAAQAVAERGRAPHQVLVEIEVTRPEVLRRREAEVGRAGACGDRVPDRVRDTELDAGVRIVEHGEREPVRSEHVVDTEAELRGARERRAHQLDRDRTRGHRPPQYRRWGARGVN